MKKFSYIILAFLMTAGMLSAKEGALSGRFTVNAQGKQIVFSQGNLQYNPSTDTWRFADSQLTAIGFYNGEISSSTYNGWLDLFGWGTGTNPTNYSTDWHNYPTYNEWGDNAISNGGNAQNQWRTLTMSEWDYLFFRRPNAASLFGFVQIDDIKGLILLPDNWTAPDGISFNPSTTKGLAAKSDYYANTDGKNYNHNTFTSAQWSQMESAGAVFLPAAGYRWDNEVYMQDSDLGCMGYYWSATPNDNWQGYELYFDAYELSPQNKNSRIHGQAVRLVTDNLTESIEPVTGNPSPVTRKVIYNGKVYILQSGTTYTLTGSEIKQEEK